MLIRNVKQSAERIEVASQRRRNTRWLATDRVASKPQSPWPRGRTPTSRSRRRPQLQRFGGSLTPPRQREFSTSSSSATGSQSMPDTSPRSGSAHMTFPHRSRDRRPRGVAGTPEARLRTTLFGSDPRRHEPIRNARVWRAVRSAMRPRCGSDPADPVVSSCGRISSPSGAPPRTLVCSRSSSAMRNLSQRPTAAKI
jgi:hypothetical protein